MAAKSWDRKHYRGKWKFPDLVKQVMPTQFLKAVSCCVSLFVLIALHLSTKNQATPSPCIPVAVSAVDRLDSLLACMEEVASPFWHTLQRTMKMVNKSEQPQNNTQNRSATMAQGLENTFCPSRGTCESEFRLLQCTCPNLIFMTLNLNHLRPALTITIDERSSSTEELLSP